MGKTKTETPGLPQDGDGLVRLGEEDPQPSTLSQVRSWTPEELQEASNRLLRLLDTPESREIISMFATEYLRSMGVGGSVR